MKEKAVSSYFHNESEEYLLTVAVLSLDIALGDVEENLRRVEAMIAALPEKTDVALLPELFTTSFMRDTDRMLTLAEGNDGATMAFIARLALSRNMMIAGSFLARDVDENGDSHFYNRGFMILPDGNRCFYDKHHLFCLSQEANLLSHGQQRRPIVAFRGWNISMMICYELRFPVWSRNVDMQADLLLVPANWPINRGYAWKHLLIARAIENQLVVAGADRSGCDDYGEYIGLSMIVDQLGRQIAPKPLQSPVGCPLPDNYGEQIPMPYGPIDIATLSLNNISKLRGWLPTDRDADRFTFVE